MHYVDLSYPLSDGMPVYPNDAPLRLVQEKRLSEDGYTTYTLQSGLHTGTHIDVPMHLVDDSRTVEQFPLEDFVGQGVLLDVRGQAVIDVKPEYEQLVAPNDIVLVYTDFCSLLEHPQRYYADQPVLTEAFADFLLRKQVKLLGLDLPSPDLPPFIVHKKLLAGGIPLLENLTNLNALVDAPCFHVFAVPLKLQAEASLVRAFAEVST